MSSIESNVIDLLPTDKPYLKTLMRFLGYSLTCTLGWVPRPLGTILRGVLYRPALGYMEGFPFIHGTGVELLGSDQIGISNGVRLMRDVCINALGFNSKVMVRANARIARGVDISVTPMVIVRLKLVNLSILMPTLRFMGQEILKLATGA